MRKFLPYISKHTNKRETNIKKLNTSKNTWVSVSFIDAHISVFILFYLFIIFLSSKAFIMHAINNGLQL